MIVLLEGGVERQQREERDQPEHGSDRDGPDAGDIEWLDLRRDVGLPSDLDLIDRRPTTEGIGITTPFARPSEPTSRCLTHDSRLRPSGDPPFADPRRPAGRDVTRSRNRSVSEPL